MKTEELMEVIKNYTSVVEIKGALYYQYDWFRREVQRYDLHPVIQRLLDEGYEPNSKQELVLQWPHVSTQDDSKLAYTRTVEHGVADRQTVTRVGKYVRQHFCAEVLPDHVLRDIVGAVQEGERMGIVYTTEEMIDIVQRGPGSCMKDDWDTHPYECYDPSLGWGLAYHKSPFGDILGRALVYTDKDSGTKSFVRSYYVNDDGFSGDDHALEQWLRDQGYAEFDGWEYGTRLLRVQSSYNDDVAPYLDGCHQHVYEMGNYYVVCEEGNADYVLESPNGEPIKVNMQECEECGDSIDMDEGEHDYAGFYQDTLVCAHCANNYFTWARTRLGCGETRLLREEETTYVDSLGESFATDDLDYFNVCELENGCREGEYVHIDDTVTDVDGALWHVDDVERGYLVRLTAGEYEDEYVDADSSWTCSISGDVYSDNDPHVVVNGDWVHPDNVPAEQAA